MAIVIQNLRFNFSARILAGLVACLVPLLVFRAHACPLQLSSINLSINGVQLNLEIAATPEARQCGLSGRKALPPDAGMLFVLPRTMPFAVWMKGTRLPLDIAFIDETGRIVAIKQMDPQHNDRIYTAPQPVRYAIEVNRGWFDQRHIRAGQNLEISVPHGIQVR